MSRTGIPQAMQSPALPRPAVRPHHSKALSQPLYVCFAFLQPERRRRIFSSVPHAFYYHNTWSRLQVNRLLLFFENIFQAGFTRASLEKGTLLLNRFKSRVPSAPQRRRKRLPDRKSWSKPPFGKSGNPLFRQPYPQIFHPEFCHWAGGCGQKLEGTQLIAVESTSYIDNHGMKWNGNNQYTMPIQVAMDRCYQQQMLHLEEQRNRQAGSFGSFRGR